MPSVSNFTSGVRVRISLLVIACSLGLLLFCGNFALAQQAVGKSPSQVAPAKPSATALADSEYFWQAYEDEFIFYPRFDYHYSVQNQSDLSLNNYSLGGSTYYFLMQAEYGIADLIAIGVKSGYGSGVSQLSLWNPAYYYYGSNGSGGSNQIASLQTTSQGVDNIDFYSKLRYRFSKHFTTYAGINFNWSPDSHRITSITGDSNLFTGGNTFSGHIGAEYGVKKFIIGVDFNADIYKSAMTTINYYGLQLNSNGGLSRSFTGFGELVGKGFQLGAAFSYITHDKSTLSQPNQLDSVYDAVNMIAIKGYGAIMVTDWFNILPSFTYESLLNKTLNGRNVTQQYDMIGSIGARFSL
jgi:hypothetical protein